MFAAPSSSSNASTAAAALPIKSSVFSNDVALPYTVEWDADRNIVDLYSKKKTSSKNFERVVSLKVTENLFHIKRVISDAKDVSDAWLCSVVEPLVALSPAERKTAASKKPSSPSGHGDHVVTPSGSPADMHKRKVDTTTGEDKSILSGMTLSAIESFITMFFSVPLSSIKEDDTVAVDKDQVIPLLISIEGNIGAGKSFLLGKLREAHPEWCFIDEPVEFWESLRNDTSESLLEVFYKDQRRWSYTFQNCALLSRFHNIETAITKVRQKEASEAQGIKRPPMVKVFITERCLDTDHEVFAKMLHSDGQLDALEIDLYQRWFRLLQKTATQLGAIVYVDTQPELCSERINIRNRDGEEGIPIEYLQSLDKFQRQWIDTTAVPITRTTSDTIEQVDQFVEKLIRDYTPAV